MQKIIFLLCLALVACKPKNEEVAVITPQRELSEIERRILEDRRLPVYNHTVEQIDWEVLLLFVNDHIKEYKKKNGDRITSMRYYSIGASSVEVSSQEPYVEILKDYHPNGQINSVQKIAKGFRNRAIGKSIYYDEYGNKTIIDNDTLYGALKYNDIVRLLINERLIDDPTKEIGGHRFEESEFGVKYIKEVNFWYAVISIRPMKLWIEKLKEWKALKEAMEVQKDLDKQHKEEPCAETHIYAELYIDGDTGKIYLKNEYDKGYYVDYTKEYTGVDQ